MERLIEQETHTIPRPTKKIRRVHGFQGDQRVFTHWPAIERELYGADFLTRPDWSDQWLLILHSGFQFIRLMLGKRKINILAEPCLELILGALPQLNGS